MTKKLMSNWEFLERLPSRSAGGDAFRNMFEQQSPHVSLARESIQNADDAREMHKKVLRMSFQFCSGIDLSPIADSEFRAHVAQCHRLQLPDGALDSVLYVEDYGTTGLTGSMLEMDSPMFGLMGKLGGSAKVSGQGGSFGYGKGACIRNSGLYMVLAYTVTAQGSALFGTCYLDAHKLGGKDWLGTGWFCAPGSTQDEPTEFRDDEADEMAIRLGVPRAHPANRERGTTLIIPCPTLDPQELRRAIAHNWWPKILRQELEVDICANGKQLAIDPSSFRELKPYIELYDNMNRGGEGAPGDYLLGLTGTGKRKLGKLGIRVCQTGHVETDEEGEFQNGIALIRKPRMVVQYHTWSRGPAQSVVGVFEADDGVNGDLQMTEDMSHSAWTKTSDRSTPEQKKLASDILMRIHQEHNKIMSSYVPPPGEDGLVLSGVRRFFGDLLGGSGQTGGAADADPIKIFDKEAKVNLVGDQLVMEGGCAVQWIGSRQATLTVQVRVVLVEGDLNASGDEIDAEVTVDGKTASEGGTMAKTMQPKEIVRLSFRSVGYDPEYTATVHFTAAEVKDDAQ